MPPSKESQTLDLASLDLSELAGLRDSVESEVQRLTESVIALQRAAGDFGKSGEAIQRLAEREGGQPMLVPVTSSLYVEGTVRCTDRVTVDVGTGYFVECSAPKGIKYCKRKVLFLKDQNQKLLQDLKSKQRVLSKVRHVFDQKSKKL